MVKDTQTHKKVRGRIDYSAYLETNCYQSLLFLLICLDAYLDRRLVQTFLRW